MAQPPSGGRGIRDLAGTNTSGSGRTPQPLPGRGPHSAQLPRQDADSGPHPATGPQASGAHGSGRLRRAATEPGRLRAIGTLLAVLMLGFGALTAWQVSDRTAAAAHVAGRSERLCANAAGIHRALADADTTAAAGFLAGGEWPRSVRERYGRDIDTASALLVEAAADDGGPDSASRAVAELNRQLPRYTGLVEQARANHRQGLPLGGAYLRYANDRMRRELLRDARALYVDRAARLEAERARAEERPWPAVGAGATVLVALLAVQHRDRRRTKRVFNLGLLSATIASAATLAWLAAGHEMARSRLSDDGGPASRSVRLLDDARIQALQAGGDESLTFVAGGSVLTADGEDFYEAAYRKRMARLVGEADGSRAQDGSFLARAGQSADDAEGRKHVRAAVTGAVEWRERHEAARTKDEAGDREGALGQIIGDGRTTRESSDRVDTALASAVGHERLELRHAARSARDLLGELPLGAALLTSLATVCALLGIGRRLAEYR